MRRPLTRRSLVMSGLTPDENDFFWEALLRLLLGISFGVRLDSQCTYSLGPWKAAACFSCSRHTQI